MDAPCLSPRLPRSACALLALQDGVRPLPAPEGVPLCSDVRSGRPLGGGLPGACVLALPGRGSAKGLAGGAPPPTLPDQAQGRLSL